MENKRYIVIDSVVLAHVCGYPVLATTRDELHEENMSACILNEAGEYVWHQLSERRTVEEIVQNASRDFEETPEIVREGIRSCLQILLEQRLIREIEE